ncbi:hypothetical protein [Legionella bononiensis]|uniref:Uncharacterized protein n=1 Tax=Legionella bononiensis TaxID=2793102 RepID=A0ABS1WCN3_9GAMM|nr:hypothetical protein [Legionella bononiensis]MBL7478980.1 hypothetical protein [Legionella bononiensis]MBL7527112.1 hypothetical protein [Legionella bononiensis]MBL7562081.1 hypothetical protein [Legionella bononiensis]
MYETGFYKRRPLEKPSLDLCFEHPDKNKLVMITELKSSCIRGVVINRQSEHTITLTAVPLITCSAYIFSFTNYDGVEKAIIYHATSPGPRYAGWIASQIKSETDLSTVSIIIATPGNPSRHPDLNEIGDIHSEYLHSVGFTSKIQILFDCDRYMINNKGKHGVEKFEHDLVFHKVPHLEECTEYPVKEHILDENTCSCLLL